MSVAASKQYYFTSGKRKTAVARVKLYEGGKGEFTVNGMKIREYFQTALQVENATAPLRITDTLKKFDATIEVAGGGKSAQSDAIRHGFSRALLIVDAGHRPTLKREGFLRRDARVKERKKPGLKRARRAPQFSKR